MKVIIAFQYVKCGFAGDNFPTHVFPSVVGRPLVGRYTGNRVGNRVRIGFPNVSPITYDS